MQWQCDVSVDVSFLYKSCFLCVIQSIFFRFTFKSVTSFDFFNVLTAQLTPYCYNIIPISLKTNNFFFSLAFKRVELHTAFLWFFSSFIILKHYLIFNEQVSLKLFRINKMFSGHFFHSYYMIYELSVCMFFIHLFSELDPIKYLVFNLTLIWIKIFVKSQLFLLRR